MQNRNKVCLEYHSGECGVVNFLCECTIPSPSSIVQRDVEISRDDLTYYKRDCAKFVCKYVS